MHCCSIFVCQDPLKASDKPLSDCGPYILDEEDAMVYRRPYLTSGASGFALTTLSRNMKKELKVIGAFQRLMCMLLLYYRHIVARHPMCSQYFTLSQMSNKQTQSQFMFVNSLRTIMQLMLRYFA